MEEFKALIYLFHLFPVMVYTKSIWNLNVAILKLAQNPHLMVIQ